MSGIFGFWHFDGRPANPAILDAMAGTLSHRGPDGWDGWCRGSLAIGHRMFRTTPEARFEHQPIISGNGHRVLAADLRLDNRPELIAQLGLRGYRASELSDASLLWEAISAHGTGTAERLLGAFAYVSWDDGGQILHCARDHMGVKPFYYYHAPGRLFAFASEIKALWKLCEISDEIDELQVARHLLVPVREDLRGTYYRHIKRLLPGHVLIVTAEGVAERRYWALDAERSLKLASDAEYAEAVREAFTEAVRCRMRTQSPLGCMLSGGIDSSSVTCVAATVRKRDSSAPPLMTLSAVYPDVPECDERKYISAVHEAYDTQANYFRADSVSPIAEASRLNFYVDGANEAGNLYINATLYRLASERGARVVLDGYDGDTTISHGLGRLTELARNNRWITLASEVRASAATLNEAWLPAYWAWLRRHGIPPALRRSRSHDAPSLKHSERTWAGRLTDEFFAGIRHHIGNSTLSALTEREHHHHLLTRIAHLHGISMIEATGAGSGVEVRFPFLDVRLIELCLSLPPEQKLRRGVSRFVMKEAMRGILPAIIRARRDKSNLTPGFKHALHWNCATPAEDVLRRASPALASYIEPGYLEVLCDGYRRGALSASEEALYWKILWLALWLGRSDRAQPAPTEMVGPSRAFSLGTTPRRDHAAA